MREVTEHLRRIAPSLAAVMLVGESGTGKEVAAELLHAHSARASGPFVERELRRHPGEPGRGRAVRLRARRVHRRRAPASGLLRARVRRNAVPRRDHRDADRPAGEAAARARKRAHGPRRRHRGDRHRRPHRDGDESPAGRGRPRAPAARGPLLSARRVPGPPAAAAPARRRHRAAGATRSSAQLNGENGTASASIAARWRSPRPHSWPGNVRELKNCVERSYVLSRRHRQAGRAAGARTLRRRRAMRATACACRSA